MGLGITARSHLEKAKILKLWTTPQQGYHWVRYIYDSGRYVWALWQRPGKERVPQGFWPQLYKCGRCQGEGPQEKAESTSVFSQVIRDRGSHTCFCYSLRLRCPSSTLGAWFPFYPWMAEMMFTMLQSSPEDYMMSWISLMLKISPLLLHLLIFLKSGCNFHLVVFENYYLGLFFFNNEHQWNWDGVLNFMK